MRKIGNDTSRNRETSKFQTYIDEVKRERPTVIAILLGHMREDTQMSVVTTQHGVYDGDVVMRITIIRMMMLDAANTLLLIVMMIDDW